MYTCSQCHFCKEEGYIYYCLRFPPTLKCNKNKDPLYAPFSEFPDVREGWWCGEFKLKIGEETE